MHSIGIDIRTCVRIIIPNTAKKARTNRKLIPALSLDAHDLFLLRPLELMVWVWILYREDK